MFSMSLSSLDSKFKPRLPTNTHLENTIYRPTPQREDLVQVQSVH